MVVGLGGRGGGWRGAFNEGKGGREGGRDCVSRQKEKGAKYRHTIPFSKVMIPCARNPAPSPSERS